MNPSPLSPAHTDILQKATSLAELLAGAPGSAPLPVPEAAAMIARFLVAEAENEARRTERLRATLAPFAAIDELWQRNELDESRPQWGHSREKAAKEELVGGRGGACLLTIGHCFAAKAALEEAAK